MSEFLDKLDVSSGVKYLTKGYIDYAEEVIAERANPNLYDGLKPVNRKLLWTFHENIKEVGKMVKSKTITGQALKYHPHDDSAVYKASVLMTDKNGFSAVPMLKGHGNLGNVSSGESAAASRYTDMALSNFSEELFGELDGIDMMMNYDSTAKEPTVLPVSFPLILCQASEGIAVGFASKIPAFNFNDVLDLTIEYIQNGECKTVIAPDFTTRGYYVQNNKELLKLMKTGKSALKLRGEVIVSGKEIQIKEVPFGRNVVMLKNQIDKLNLSGVRSVSNLCDKNHGVCLSIVCNSKNAVDSVLYQIYKDSDLQYTYHSNITVVQDGVPRELGVHGIIEEWVKWRRKVVKRSLENTLEGVKERSRECCAFVNLINSGKQKELCEVIVESGTQAGVTFLEENFTRDEIPADLLKWVATRSINSYHKGGKYAEEYTRLMAEISTIEGNIEDVDSYIVAQLKALKAKYGTNMPRLTKITNKDYEFVREDESVEVDDRDVQFVLRDNFLQKSLYGVGDEEGLVFNGKASDILIGFDNKGQILRIHAKDIPVVSPSDRGTYLPRYLEIEADDDYQILWMGVLDGSEKMILYRDGNIGFLDTSEFVGSKRQIRVLQNGIHSSADLVCEVFDDIPEALVVVDYDGRVGYCVINDTKKKSRTARTKVFRNSVGLAGYIPLNEMEIGNVIVGNAHAYNAPHVRYLLNIDDFNSDYKEIISM